MDHTQSYQERRHQPPRPAGLAFFSSSPAPTTIVFVFADSGSASGDVESSFLAVDSATIIGISMIGAGTGTSAAGVSGASSSFFLRARLARFGFSAFSVLSGESSDSASPDAVSRTVTSVAVSVFVLRRRGARFGFSSTVSSAALILGGGAHHPQVHQNSLSHRH